MRRKLVMLSFVIVLLLPGCQWPWHARMTVKPSVTEAKSSMTEEAAPVKRTTKKYRIIIRPTSRPAIEEVPNG